MRPSFLSMPFALLFACGSDSEPGDTATPADGDATAASDTFVEDPDAPDGPDATVDSANDASAEVVAPSARAVIDANGGTVTLQGATLEVPAGALTTATEIALVATTADPPAGYRGFSKVFRVEPDGLALAVPAIVTLPFSGDAKLATLFWSRPDGATGYERIGGVLADGKLRARVEHFSGGFIADGVDYSEPPDRSCVVTRLIEGRTVIASGPALFFSAEDCQGRPIIELAASDIVLREDGVALGSEARSSILERAAPQSFVVLALDMSSSTAPMVTEVIAGAKAFVDALEASGSNAQVAVQLFDGGGGSYARLGVTPDFDAVRQWLDKVPTMTPSDPMSTDLNSAVYEALLTSERHREGFAVMSEGGALTTTYAVVFTDGRDTAGRIALQQVLDLAAASPTELVLVGLRSSPDFDRAALEALASSSVIVADEPQTLARDFANVARRIVAQSQRTHLLGYCSPKRSGDHVVSVELAGARMLGSASFPFTAGGEGASCRLALFDTCAPDVECGGLGCGACPALHESCSNQRCVDNCVLAGSCDVVANNLSQVHSCAERTDFQSCDGNCLDIRVNPEHCGSCGTACPPVVGRGCAGSSCFGITGVTELAARATRTCARFDDGRVACWGLTSAALPTFENLELRWIAGIEDAVRVEVSSDHACAITSSGGVKCWGEDSAHQLGSGEVAARSETALDVDGLSDVVGLALAASTTCALRADATVHCWGANSTGEVGDGTQTARKHPVHVTTLERVVSIAASDRHFCAVAEDGTVRCWGGGGAALELGTRGSSLTPRMVDNVSNARALALDSYTSCALLDDTTVKCWGSNHYGHLGRGEAVSVSLAESVVGLSGVIGIEAGAAICARRGDGAVLCWGQESSFIEESDQIIYWLPTVVPWLAGATELAIGNSHRCAVRADSSVICWGLNNRGQLGDGTNVPRYSP